MKTKIVYHEEFLKNISSIKLKISLCNTPFVSKQIQQFHVLAMPVAAYTNNIATQIRIEYISCSRNE